MSDDHDAFLDLRERFTARGVHLRSGNTVDDMLKHLLDTIEEQAVEIASLRADVVRLRKDLGG